LTGQQQWREHKTSDENGVISMRYLLAFLAMLAAVPASGNDDLVLPTVDFSASAVHEAGAFKSSQTIHYTLGILRIDRGNGFSSTILDLDTQTQYLLMVNHTYLVLPMDDELFRRFIARTVIVSGSHKVGAQRIAGMATTKYAFGDDGALNAAGFYWLSNAGIMVRREYDNGVFGQKVHHLEYLSNITLKKQPVELFKIPAGYKRAN